MALHSRVCLYSREWGFLSAHFKVEVICHPAAGTSFQEGLSSCREQKMGETGPCSKELMWGRIKGKWQAPLQSWTGFQGQIARIPTVSDSAHGWENLSLVHWVPRWSVCSAWNLMWKLFPRWKMIPQAWGFVGRMILVKRFISKAYENVALDGKTLKWKLDWVWAFRGDWRTVTTMIPNSEPR